MQTSHSNRFNTKNPERGVTLLELSLVVLLVAILLGFSLPRFTTLYESDLELETKKLAKIIKDLRLQAIIEEKRFRLVFNTKKSSYKVLEQISRDQSEFKPSKQFSKAVKLTEPVEFYQISNEVQNQEELRFSGAPIIFEKIFGQEFHFSVDSSGFIDPFTVRLRDQKFYMTLSVYDIMGNIRIETKRSL